MSLPTLCIRRPVMTTLLMVASFIFGAVAYFSLPVSELRYPPWTPQPPFGMVAQGVGQGKFACLDVNLHRVLRCLDVS